MPKWNPNTVKTILSYVEKKAHKCIPKWLRIQEEWTLEDLHLASKDKRDLHNMARWKVLGLAYVKLGTSSMLVCCRRCSWSHGLRPKKFYTSVAVTPAPVRVPTQWLLVPGFMSVVDQVENFLPCLHTHLKQMTCCKQHVLALQGYLSTEKNTLMYKHG